MRRLSIQAWMGAVVLGLGGASCSDGILNTGADTAYDTATENRSDTTPSPIDTGTAPVIDSDWSCVDGVPYENLCFYLGEENQNCIETCETRGAYNEKTATYLGTAEEGGAIEHCATILPHLVQWGYGMVRNVYLGYCGVGLGCHVTNRGMLSYTLDVKFDATHKSYYARRVCACGPELE